ncbi:MAG: helix-turn-helix domain-containing protein [Acidimicrobiia bacterium]
MNEDCSLSANRYPEIPPLSTARGVAALLACSERKVRDLIARGELPCVRVGRLVRVPRHVVLEILRYGTVACHNNESARGEDDESGN